MTHISAGEIVEDQDHCEVCWARIKKAVNCPGGACYRDGTEQSMDDCYKDAHSSKREDCCDA